MDTSKANERQDPIDFVMNHPVKYTWMAAKEFAAVIHELTLELRGTEGLLHDLVGHKFLDAKIQEKLEFQNRSFSSLRLTNIRHIGGQQNSHGLPSDRWVSDSQDFYLDESGYWHQLIRLSCEAGRLVWEDIPSGTEALVAAFERGSHVVDPGSAGWSLVHNLKQVVTKECEVRQKRLKKLEDFSDRIAGIEERIRQVNLS